MNPPTRRQFAGYALGVATLAGCLDLEPGAGPDESGADDGTPGGDLLLRNCLQEERTLSVTVTRVETGETVHEGTHGVPTDSCSDFGDPVEVASVFPAAGEYEVHASTSGLEPATATVTLSESEASGDGTRVIRIDEDGISID